MKLFWGLMLALPGRQMIAQGVKVAKISFSVLCAFAPLRDTSGKQYDSVETSRRGPGPAHPRT